jgi:hypothetical protein
MGRTFSSENQEEQVLALIQLFRMVTLLVKFALLDLTAREIFLIVQRLTALSMARLE